MPGVFVSHCMYLLEYVDSVHISEAEVVFKHLVMWLYIMWSVKIKKNKQLNYLQNLICPPMKNIAFHIQVDRTDLE